MDRHTVPMTKKIELMLCEIDNHEFDHNIDILWF